MTTYTNHFDQIYQAGLHKNAKLLPPKGTYRIYECKAASITTAAAQLSLEGQHEAAEWLTQQGASIDEQARLAAIFGCISSKYKQVYFLSYFPNEKKCNQLVSRLSTLDEPVHIEPSTVKRAAAIVNLRYRYGYSFYLAYLSTNAAKAYDVSLNNDGALITSPTTQYKPNSGALVMLAAFIYFNTPFPSVNKEQTGLLSLPDEIWLHIFEYIFESNLTSSEFNQLGYLTGKSMLLHPLHCYRDKLWWWQSEKKNHVGLLIKDIMDIGDICALRNIVHSHSNPASPYASIFREWDSRLVKNAGDPETPDPESQHATLYF